MARDPALCLNSRNSICMNRLIVESSEAICLVAGGAVPARDMALARRHAPVVVAADGGADRALALGVEPVAVIGDLDSLSDSARLRLAQRLHEVPEQETTDFDKVLRHVAAPFVLALGVAGGRVDHALSVLAGLLRHQAARPDMPCVILGPQDVIFAAPPVLHMTLSVGDRVSLFPMVPVTGRSQGLEWPIDGLTLAPDGRIGTSNRASARRVVVDSDRPGLLVILPRRRLAVALAALTGKSA